MRKDFVCKTVTDKTVIKDFLGLESSSIEYYYGIFDKEGDLVGIIGYLKCYEEKEILLIWAALWCNMTEKILTYLFKQFIANICPSNYRPVVAVLDDDDKKIIRKLIKRNVLPLGTKILNAERVH